MSRSEKDVMNIEIGKRLKEVRENNKFTQEEIAAALSVGEKQYQRYEYGESTLPYDRLNILAKEFDYDIRYIVSGVKQDVDIYAYVVTLSYEDKVRMFSRMNEYMILMMQRQT